MTYTLFEWAKENMEELMADQPESAPVNPVSNCLNINMIMFNKIYFDTG